MFRRRTRSLVVLVSFVIVGTARPSANGQAVVASDDRPRVRAVRLPPGESIRVDGVLDEPVWGRALPATDFTQQDPFFGERATERTEVQFAFSESTLYMAVICYDSEPDQLMGNTMQRDAFLSADDRFMWTLDPYGNGLSGYFFEMNPSGAMGDSLITASEATGGGGGGDNNARAWDGIWYAQVEKSDIGWTIEIEIPFRTLNFDPTAPAWGVNFQRTVRRKSEESLWTAFARNQGLRRMSSAGQLEGISKVNQGIGLDVQPFVSAKQIAAPGRNIPSDYEMDGGVDLIYSITPQLKVNFTVNTDFAETEMDQQLVNLTRFPLFFPERRTFFLEGITFFNFAREQGNAITPFFSRRIGLKDGQQQPIDYGVTLTGQSGANDIGFLEVRTRENEDFVGEDFTVFRGRRRFLEQSYAGVLYTRRAERETAVPDRQTVGLDFQLATSRFRGSEILNFSGYYLWTTASEGESSGVARGLRVEYPNDLWDIRMAYREIHAGYDPGVGFFDRRNIRRYNPDLRFQPRPKSPLVRQFRFRVDPEWWTDLDNQLVTRIITLGAAVDFQSEDRVDFTMLPTYERLERDFEISDRVVLPAGGEYRFTRYQVQAETANRRLLSAMMTYEDGTFFSGTRRDFALNLGVRPQPGVLINFENEWNRVEFPEGAFSTRIHRLNVNTQFSPWVFVINNIQYDSVSRVLGWQARFRWILRPGNDLFFVYAQNWRDDPVAGRVTLDRSTAAKLSYTHRF